MSRLLYNFNSGLEKVKISSMLEEKKRFFEFLQRTVLVFFLGTNYCCL